MFRVPAVLAVLVAAVVALPGALGAQTLIPVKVGTLPTDGCSVVFDAKELGFFQKNGLDVDIQTMSSGPAIAAAVAGGALDIGVANVATVAQARLRGLPFRYIAPSSMAEPSTMTDVVLVAADSTIRTGADLNNKTIAINGLKDLQQITAMAWVDKHGGDSKTLHFVEMPIPQMAAAVEAHRVDAALDVEPFVSSAVAQRQGKVIGDVLDGVAPRFMVVGWLALDPWIQAHADTVARFATAMRQAAAWANTHHRESAAILVRNTKVPASVADTMARAQFGQTLDAAMIRPIVDAAVKYGVLAQPVDPNDLIWHP
jgi:NitT/TauT family transport system substrate-binding protein